MPKPTTKYNFQGNEGEGEFIMGGAGDESPTTQNYLGIEMPVGK